MQPLPNSSTSSRRSSPAAAAQHGLPDAPRLPRRGAGGPITCFRLLRLHAVRNALKAARGGGLGVAGIAAAWGFHRPGAFATEYRQQFGEAPSITLGVRGCRGVQSRVRAATPG
jgi:AraC-like DNA-binding protein